ncbi:MAG: DUF1697 domain-containing protein [Ilumatobacteraceae bacterium]
MTVFVGLIRGVNVGGRSKLAMADLRRIAEGCGFEDVHTYVQSGNVVFRSSGAAAAVAKQLRSAIAAETSLDPGIAVRTAAQLTKVVDGCPFDDTANVHVTFLVEGATPKASAVDPDEFAPERFAVKGREVYLYLPNGMGRSKLAVALSKGKATLDGTTRNWRTVTKLVELTSRS